MLGVRRLERRAPGPVGLMAFTSIDILLNGRVLGIAFAAKSAEGQAGQSRGRDAEITNAMEDLQP
jgi:ZIP family zinc transporter